MIVRKSASMFELAIHDFVKTFRRLPEGLTELEFFKLLIARRESREKSLARSLITAILLVVACAIGGVDQSVNIKSPLLELSVPKIYLVFLASYATAMSIYDAMSYTLLVAFQSKAANRLSKRLTNPNMLVVPFGSAAEWTFLPENRYDLLRAKRSYFGEFSAIAVVIVPGVCLYFSIYIMVFAQVFVHFSFSTSNVFMGNIIAVLTVLIAIAPLIFLPFPFRQRTIEKNLEAIRWRFLFQIYRREGRQPPAMGRWLGWKNYGPME